MASKNPSGGGLSKSAISRGSLPRQSSQREKAGCKIRAEEWRQIASQAGAGQTRAAAAAGGQRAAAHVFALDEGVRQGQGHQ
jgi:hypothetical protein